MLPLVSHGANLSNRCPFPDSSALYVQNWFSIRPSVRPQFPSLLNCWPHTTTHNAPCVLRFTLFGIYPFPDESAHVCQIWCQSVQPFGSFSWICAKLVRLLATGRAVSRKNTPKDNIYTNGSSTKQTLKSEHSQTASRLKDISPKVVSAGLVIYSGLHQIILHSPSTPSTRGQRNGRDDVEPLARDGVTSSAKIENSWGQHWWRLPTSPSTVPAGGQPLLLVPSPRPRGKSLSEWVSGIVGLIVWAYVHSQMNPQTCTKFGANRSSRLTASQDFWMWDHLTPLPDMPPGVLRGDLYLAYVHSQMNLQMWTKVGANWSSRLTASHDFWMFDPLKPPECPLCLSWQFILRISIPRWICTCVPNLMPIGPAVWYLPLTFEFVTPLTPPPQCRGANCI